MDVINAALEAALAPGSGEPPAPTPVVVSVAPATLTIAHRQVCALLQSPALAPPPTSTLPITRCIPSSDHHAGGLR
ncbi:hypothetical protein DV515_00015805 [Chloebia gouldiae]|uniref:Uncharacterized protein n=1 Tax=Chloebia gouldiae TaxID=44316 RepID=A0A3L8RUA9_CHLGU|nr:hypothetical protein DV515_00015805 [Chloebia gouldiae]